MDLSREQISNAARVACFSLSEAETENTASWLASFFELADILGGLDLSGYSAEDAPVAIDTLRADVAVSFVSKQALLCCAPDAEKDGIVVPGVVE